MEFVLIFVVLMACGFGYKEIHNLEKIISEQQKNISSLQVKLDKLMQPTPKPSKSENNEVSIFSRGLWSRLYGKN